MLFNDLLTFTFSFLPPQDLLHVESVCKRWKTASVDLLWEKYCLPYIDQPFDKKSWKKSYKILNNWLSNKRETIFTSDVKKNSIERQTFALLNDGRAVQLLPNNDQNDYIVEFLNEGGKRSLHLNSPVSIIGTYTYENKWIGINSEGVIYYVNLEDYSVIQSQTNIINLDISKTHIQCQAQEIIIFDEENIQIWHVENKQIILQKKFSCSTEKLIHVCSTPDWLICQSINKGHLLCYAIHKEKKEFIHASTLASPVCPTKIVTFDNYVALLHVNGNIDINVTDYNGIKHITTIKTCDFTASVYFKTYRHWLILSTESVLKVWNIRNGYPISTLEHNKGSFDFYTDEKIKHTILIKKGKKCSIQ